MTLTLQRLTPIGPALHGDLSIEGQPFGVTLENTAKQIPAGIYEVRLYPSARFRRLVPILCDVPGRFAIELHVGNTIEDTTGCVLVGLERSGQTIVHSVAAFEALMKVIRPQLTAQRKVELDVRNAV